eukprot:sb/3473445/
MHETEKLKVKIFGWNALQSPLLHCRATPQRACSICQNLWVSTPTPKSKFCFKAAQENVKIWVPSIANNSSILAFETVYSNQPTAMWLRGYSRLKKVGLENKSVLFLLVRTCKQASRHPDYNRAQPHTSALLKILHSNNTLKGKTLPCSRPN